MLGKVSVRAYGYELAAEFFETANKVFIGHGGAQRLAKPRGVDFKSLAALSKQAEDFINLGASRLGTSRVVKAVKAMEN